MSMRGTLERRLDYLDGGTRRRVVDDVLAELHHPSASMLKTGAERIRRGRTCCEPADETAEHVFADMIGDAVRWG